MISKMQGVMTTVYNQIMDKKEGFKKSLDLIHELIPWADGELKLERPEGSVSHRMVKSGVVEIRDKPNSMGPINVPFDGETQIFIVQHDWASAFNGADEFEHGDFTLPFDSCCFEFRVSGRRVCALVGNFAGDKFLLTLVEGKAGWASPVGDSFYMDGIWIPPDTLNDNPFLALTNFMGGHIRAICIALEAEVAIAETIEAPERLNRARVKRGDLPLPNYSIISLNRKPHPVPLAGAGEGGGKRRLHFRRGHWRHYETHKTWIKWMLVGNPDLGFIEKQYRA